MSSFQDLLRPHGETVCRQVSPQLILATTAAQWQTLPLASSLDRFSVEFIHVIGKSVLTVFVPHACNECSEDYHSSIKDENTEPFIRQGCSDGGGQGRAIVAEIFARGAFICWPPPGQIFPPPLFVCPRFALTFLNDQMLLHYTHYPVPSNVQ